MRCNLILHLLQEKPNSFHHGRYNTHQQRGRRSQEPLFEHRELPATSQVMATNDQGRSGLRLHVLGSKSQQGFTVALQHLCLEEHPASFLVTPLASFNPHGETKAVRLQFYQQRPSLPLFCASTITRKHTANPGNSAREEKKNTTFLDRSSVCQTSQVQKQRNLEVEIQTKSLVKLTLKAAGKKQSDFILSSRSNYFHIGSVCWG